MTSRRHETVYTEAEVTDRLAGMLSAWKLSDGQIVRRYRTGGWKASLMVANAVGHLAEVAWHHPDILLSWNVVEVRLSTHSAKGITDKDFELAQQIEAFVMWRPQGGALEGTPEDARHAYIRRE